MPWRCSRWICSTSIKYASMNYKISLSRVSVHDRKITRTSGPPRTGTIKNPVVPLSQFLCIDCLLRITLRTRCIYTRERVSKKMPRNAVEIAEVWSCSKQYTFLTNLPACALLCFIPDPRSDGKFNITAAANDARQLYTKCLHEIRPERMSSIYRPRTDPIAIPLRNRSRRDSYVFSHLCPVSTASHLSWIRFKNQNGTRLARSSKRNLSLLSKISRCSHYSSCTSLSPFFSPLNVVL